MLLLYLPLWIVHNFCYEYDMQMAREMDEILRQQIAQPANSCTSDSVDGVSFLDNVIFPLYDIVYAVSFTNFLAIISYIKSS